MRQSGRDRFALKDMLRFALKDLLRGATTPLRVYWDVKKLLDESSFFVDKREILIYRAVGGKAEGSTKGTGNSQQGTGKAAHGMLQPERRERSRDENEV